MIPWNKCPGCGITIGGDSDYCPNCGEPWTIKCSGCGLPQRFWKFHKFCPRCGMRLDWRGVAESGQK